MSLLDPRMLAKACVLQNISPIKSCENRTQVRMIQESNDEFKANLHIMKL